jgi:hypothetical protein
MKSQRSHPMDAPAPQSDELFAWTDGRVVLFVNHADAAWIVARGWRRGDRLTDVRRWTFDSERRATGQVRRLVGEATGDPFAADATAAEFTGWLATRSPLA